MIRQALILAAGYGKRMGEMTKNRPKPLTEINGISLIERLILNLVEAEIYKILVNSHYLSNMLEEHLEIILDKYSLREKIQLEISYEPELLETGGTIKKNQKFFENKPFFAINSDIIYFDLKKNLINLAKKIKEYPDAEIILTVTEIENIRGLYTEKRDFTLKNDKLYIYPENNLVYTGLNLINNVKLDHIKDEKFSINRIYTELAEKGQLYGIKFYGELFHIGDINAYMEAEQYYQLTENNS